MTVTPLDLQVLFSKSIDYAENIARTSAAAEVLKTEEEKSSVKDRNEATETVNKTNPYDEEFNKIKKDGAKENFHQESGDQKKEKQAESPSPLPHRPATLEEGKGQIIDIID